MSIPIYEDEVTIDEQGTIRLKKDGRILEKNGVWLARNYYLTTREYEKALREHVEATRKRALDKQDKKFEEKLNKKKPAKKDFEQGCANVKNSWWSKIKAMLSVNQRASK